MNFIQNILNELQQEAAVTRKHLERVPFDQATFQPQEKSETLGRLAIHVAEIIAWLKSSIQDSELNFINFKPKDIQSTTELLAYFDELLADAIQAFQTVKEKDLNQNWSMKYGEEVLFTLPKREVLRKFCMNHLIHHRSQLGVYLRLLDIPIPAVYGPSADDEEVTLIELFGQNRI